MAGAGARFVPPTADQVRTHLSRHALRAAAAGRGLWIIPVMMGVGVMCVLVLGQAATFIAPLIVVSVVYAVTSAKVKRARRLEAQADRVQELAMRRQLPAALRLAWKTLPAVTAMPELHSRSTAMIAACLDRLGAFEAAMIAYDHLIDRLPPSHPGAVQLRIQRAMAQLANDQLLDADDALRRLRGAVDGFPGTPIAAAYRLALLAQQIKTNHFFEAIDSESTLIDDLRPLGLEAGFGYALIALAHERASHAPGVGELAITEHLSSAALWWSRATLLMPVDALVSRFPETRPLAAPSIPRGAPATPAAPPVNIDSPAPAIPPTPSQAPGTGGAA